MLNGLDRCGYQRRECLHPKDDQHAVQMVPQVGKLTVFNIGGNKARLIAAIHDICHWIYIRHGLTHPEYNKGKWKET